MTAKAHGKNGAETVLASLSPDTLDKLADLVVAKLTAKNEVSCFPSKMSWVRIPSPAFLPKRRQFYYWFIS